MIFNKSLLIGAAVWLPSISASDVVLPIMSRHHPDVAITTAALTDGKRLDPFAKDGRARSIMVSSFYPIAGCHQKENTPYMPPATTSFLAAKFGAAYGLPNGTFQSLVMETCKAPKVSGACPVGSAKLVIFSGALGTSRHLYNSMCQNIAASGYVVVSIDHPYDADIVEFPDGTVVTGGNLDDNQIELAVNTRVADIDFVQQQLKNSSLVNQLFAGHVDTRRIQKFAIVGHSLGGAASAAAMQNISSLAGSVNLDGTMFGPILNSGSRLPFMLVGHENKTQETDPSWKSIWPHLTGWKKELEIKKTAHYSFSDLPLITAVTGLQDKLPAGAEQILGSMEGRRMMRLTVTYVTAFLDLVLKSGSERAFRRANKEFPEVSVVA